MTVQTAPSRRSSRIATKVALIIALPILGAIMTTLVAMTQLGAAANTVDTLISEQIANERLVAEWRAMTRASIERVIAVANSNDAELTRLMRARAEESQQRANELVKAIESFAAREPNRRALFDDITAKRKLYFVARDELYLRKPDWSGEKIRAYNDTSLMPALKTYIAAQETFVEAIAKEEHQSAEATHADFRFGRQVMIAVGIGTALLTMLLGWWFIRSVTRPLGQAVDIAEAVAHGNVDMAIEITSNDEVGKLLTAMQNMSASIRHFTLEQGAMATAHQAGATSHRMPIEQFSGAYRAMAESVNGMVQSQIELQGRLVGLIGEYANGDLRHCMERLPGDKAIISTAMDSARTTMQRASAAAEEALRSKRALDVAAASLIIADESHRVVYANASALRLLKESEADIRAAVPSFGVANLAGSPIDALCGGTDLRTLQEGTHRDFDMGKRSFTVVLNPVTDEAGVRTGTVIEWSDRTETLAEAARENERLRNERALAAENLRIRNALDNCSINMMIADKDGRIVYLNHSVLAMLQAAENDLRKALPEFDSRRLLGVSMDVFHSNPAHTRTLLSNLTGMHTAQIKIGVRTMVLNVSPVLQDGLRVGTTVEWRDRTAEVAAEQEVADLVKAAADGDFSRRLRTDGMEGFYQQLTIGLNQVMQTSQTGLNDVVRVLGALAQGDLTERMHNDYAGTFGQLKEYANRTVDQLTGIVNEIKYASESINTASREIAQGNADLSQRTEQQAASLEETAASMEELTATVRQNADNARQANQLAAGASDVAQRGGGVVDQVVSTMNGISDSSRRIVDIIAVIDGIAFQTNILALNAAVEAARAGEQGRGFAVVATEVRSLAQRSAEAAREIKTLIEESVSKVDAGTSLVDQAGKTMAEIVTSVKRVTDIMGEITNASQEQSTGITQVNQAVTQMDEATQQNAALVEEAAAAAESMQEQSENLVRSVAVFRLSKTGAKVPAKTPQTAVQAERRGPDRATNVSRIKPAGISATSMHKPAGARAASATDEWVEF